MKKLIVMMLAVAALSGCGDSGNSESASPNTYKGAYSDGIYTVTMTKGATTGSIRGTISHATNDNLPPFFGNFSGNYVYIPSSPYNVWMKVTEISNPSITFKLKLHPPPLKDPSLVKPGEYNWNLNMLEYDCIFSVDYMSGGLPVNMSGNGGGYLYKP